MTGWDCPRGETMMSFRRAGTQHIAASGRMVRTPMQMRIQVDKVLTMYISSCLTGVIP